MLPYATMISIDEASRMPVYIQIANSIIRQILNGAVKPGLRLPGSRSLANQLGVHRNTIIASYEELQSQGWLISVPAKGNFVKEDLPLAKARRIRPAKRFHSPLKVSAFEMEDSSIPTDLGIGRQGEFRLNLDDGCPDERLAPVEEIGRHLRSLLKSKSRRKFQYTWNIKGDPMLVEQLCKHLSETRGINVNPENVLISRGSIMGFYLFFKCLLKPGEKVAVASNNYQAVNTIIESFGGQLVRIPVDEEGLDIDMLEEACEKQKIRAVYIIPHHHHPTTVSLSCERRMKLIMLANRFRFAILEDDYDFDFHYRSSPILPLMSSDTEGSVVYTGSFSKCLLPAFRIGYLIAAENVINRLAYSRRFIDRQGNRLMERALAMMMEEGELKRHLRKALIVYRKRRDHLCCLLQQQLSELVEFKKPEGGMAVWVTYRQRANIEQLSERAAALGLFIAKPQVVAPHSGTFGSRLGFARMNEEEMTEAVALLHRLLSAPKA